MKLRNKKTGEIGYTGLAVDGLLPVAIEGRVAGNAEQRYRTLAELNAEWEDVPEEPKGFWMINILGIVEYTHDLPENEVEMMKQIGNKFETKEEAEKAVEKLKALTGLKNKGFWFDGYDVAHKSNGDLAGQIFYDAGKYSIEDIEKEMDLLFGGEE